MPSIIAVPMKAKIYNLKHQQSKPSDNIFNLNNLPSASSHIYIICQLVARTDYLFKYKLHLSVQSWQEYVRLV